MPSNKQRRSGAGRRTRETEEPELLEALELLIEPGTRGDPCTPLRWTCKSTRALARELTRQGYQISSTKIGQLLRSQGYSLQANRKTIESIEMPNLNILASESERIFEQGKRTAQRANPRKCQPMIFRTRNGVRRFHTEFMTLR